MVSVTFHCETLTQKIIAEAVILPEIFEVFKKYGHLLVENGENKEREEKKV